MTVDIEVTNTAEVINGISAVVSGIDPTCVELVSPLVALFPETSGTLSLRFAVPVTFPAGTYDVVVRLFSTNVDDDVVEHELVVEVAPVEAAELHLRPSLVNGGRRAEIQAVITNTGNVPTEFALLAEEPTRQLACHTVPPTVMVDPGLEASVTVVAVGRRPWFGNPVGRNIEITATSSGLELAETARFNQKPRVAAGIITSLILVGIVLLWALVFWFVISRLGQQQDAQKQVGAGFLDGSAELSLDNIGGQMSGTVTASTSGDVLDSITVEAFRERPDGYPRTADASVATGEDGTYLFTALLPGTYRLRFSAEGFDNRWCTEDGGGRRAIRVDPAQLAVTEDGTLIETCSVEMVGGSGVLQGAVPLPDGVTGVATVTVVATDAPPGDPGTVVQAEPDGSFVVGGLATPASYEVTVEFPGFEPQSTTVELAGGESATIDGSSLVGQSGTITGSVVDQNGALLGGVQVTLRSGPLERSVVTPTAGSDATGTYQFDGLATPRDYVLTFSLDGYSTATRALTLAPGETPPSTTVTLVQGSGTVTGTVSALAPGSVDAAPLGGVIVRISSETFTAETATITGSGADGTYSVTDIPVPGDYTVTFSANGYQLAAEFVSFVDPATVTVSPTLSAVTADINAVVTVGDTPRGGLVVELHDGTTRRLTGSAQVPAGAFSFPAVDPGWYTLTFWASAADADAGATPLRVFLVELTAGAVERGPFRIPAVAP